MQAYYKITKWWLDKMDAMGVSKFIPQPKGDFIQSPEEENAMLLQGDKPEANERDNHLNHMRSHNRLISNPAVPPEVKKNAVEHLREHFGRLQGQMGKEMAFGGRLGEQGTERPRETAPETIAGLR